MSASELSIVMFSGLIGVALGVALMVWHCLPGRGGADGMSEPQQSWRLRLIHAGWALRGYYSSKDAVDFLGARIASLTASLEDAHREVSRLCGEKHARDTVIHEAMEKLGSLHRQGNGDE